MTQGLTQKSETEETTQPETTLEPLTKKPLSESREKEGQTPTERPVILYLFKSSIENNVITTTNIATNPIINNPETFIKENNRETNIKS